MEVKFVEVIDIQEYLANPDNILDAEEGVVCGDGRYTKDQSGGKLARFGADGGYVLGLLAINRKYKLGLSPKQIVDAVVEAALRTNGRAFFHTDDHTPDEPSAIGCGHLGKAALAENAQDYGVDAQEVKESIAYIKELSETNPDFIEIVKLEGPHRERAVIFNMGENKKIAHGNGDLQFFMVDVNREKKHVQKLMPIIKSALRELRDLNLEEEEFNEVLEKQTNKTAEILAKGLPVFKVNVDDPQNPAIEKAGIVAYAS